MPLRISYSSSQSYFQNSYFSCKNTVRFIGATLQSETKSYESKLPSSERYKAIRKCHHTVELLWQCHILELAKEVDNSFWVKGLKSYQLSKFEYLDFPGKTEFTILLWHITLFQLKGLKSYHLKRPKTMKLRG